MKSLNQVETIAIQPHEAARLISVTHADIKSAVRSGSLPAHQLSDRKQLILVDDLRAFVKNLPLAFTGTVSALAMFAALGAAGMTAVSTPAAAQSAPSVTYTAPGGTWDNAGNWSTGNVPSSADHVGISGGRFVTVVRDGAMSGDIALEGSSSLSVSADPTGLFMPVNLNSGLVAADNSSVMVSGFGATWVNTGLTARRGAVIIDGGTMQTNSDVALVDVNPSAVLGGTWRVAGTFSLSGIGAELSLENGAALQTDRLSVAGGSLFVRGAMTGLQAGSASLSNGTISAGQGTTVVLGSTTVAGGSLSATDSSSLVTGDTALTASAAQSSALNVANGAFVSTGALTLDGTNGSVSATASSGGELATTGMTLIGPNAFARMSGALTTWTDNGLVALNGGALLLGDYVNTRVAEITMTGGSVRADGGSLVSASSVNASGGSFVASGDSTQVTIASAAGTHNGEPNDGKGDLSLSGEAIGRIESGAKLSANIARIDNASGLTVTGAGSELSTTGTMTVGGSSQSSLDVADGARVNPNTLRVGRGSEVTVSGGGQLAVKFENSPNAGSIINGGTLRVTGPGSNYSARSASPETLESDTLVTRQGRVEVTTGGAGNNRLAVRSGSAIVDGVGTAWKGDVTVGGASDGSTGVLAVQNGATVGAVRTLQNGQAEIKSGAQTSLLSVNGGSAVVSDGGKIVPTSPWAGGTVHDGSVTVTGEGSLWIASSLNIDTTRSGGSAELNVTNGGKVDVANGAVLFGYAVAAGGPSGSAGTIRVAGQGSSLIANGPLLLGTFGSGMLSITDDAKVESLGGRLGLLDGGTGTANVSTRATWDTRGDSLDLGFGGTGLVNVERGGKLLADQIRIGGVVLEDEPDTGAGTGTLAVSERGSVEAQRIVIGSQTGAGTLAIGGAPGSAAKMAGTVKAGEIALGDRGVVTFNHADPEYLFDTKITGTGRVDVLAGNTILANDHAYTGATNVFANATLTLAGLISSPTTVQAGGLLTGYGTIKGDLANAGVVAPSWCSCTRFGTMTVTGTYVSNGGGLELQTVLGGSGSQTDVLRVGSTRMGSAATQVYVSNAGGLGAADASIRIVDVTGGAAGSEAGIFSLGRRVAAGAYDYELTRKPDGDWYLQTAAVDQDEPALDPRPEVPAMAAVTDLSRLYDMQSLGTYHTRRGSMPELGAISPMQTVGWGRVFGNIGSQKGDLKQGAGSSFDYGIAGIQAGVDLYQGVHANGSVGTAGVYVSAGSASADVKNGTSSIAAGKFDLNGYTVGGYYTHKWTSGAYVDAVVQATRFDGTSSSVLSQSADTQGYGFTGSLEAGMPYLIGGGWTLEPQAQFVVQHISLDDMQDAYGRATIGDQNVVTGRVGARLSRSFLLDNGVKLDMWARASVLHSAGDFGRITVATLSGHPSASYKLAKAGTSASLEAGVAARVSDKVSLFAAGSYDAGIAGGRKGDHGFGGRLGLEVKF